MNDGRELLTVLTPQRAALESELAVAWRVQSPKNTVLLGAPNRATATAAAVSGAWFDWLADTDNVAPIRSTAIAQVRDGLTYSAGSALMQTLSAAVRQSIAAHPEMEVTALVLLKDFSASFLDNVATQHELLTLQEQERLAAQLQAGAEVGRAATSTLETSQLLREIVNLITDRFGYYYTAIFTPDHTGDYAVLREATGKAGEILKNLDHRLELHGQSLVATVMRTRQPRIASAAESDSGRFVNPLLPDTQSEIALPLLVGERVLGALDVQSVEPAAFDETSATMLQNMADQIAIALDNARLFERNQAALREAQHTQQALSRERGLLRGLIDSVPDLIFYKDLDGVYLGCNAAFEAYASRSEYELAGKTDFDLFAPDVAAYFREQDSSMLAQRASRRNEEWVTYPDGRHVLLDTLKTPFYGPDGSVLGLIGISRDITERKQAEAERERLLNRTETLYHVSAELNAARTYDAVLDVLRSHTVLLESDRQISLNLFEATAPAEPPEWAESVSQWTTLPVDALVPRLHLPEYDFLARELRADLPTPVTDIGADARLDTPSLELLARRWQGGSALFVPLVAAGQWIGFVSAIYGEPRQFGDEELRVLTATMGQAAVVVQSIRRNADLAASEARFRDVALATADWVWETDALGRYSYCSDRVTAVLGYTPAEVLGKTPFDFMPADEVARITPAFGAYVTNKEAIVDLENRNVTKDGRVVYLLTNGVPLLDADGNLIGYRGVDEDITARKIAELDRERLLLEQQKRALQLQTVSEVSRAAASILEPETLISTAVELVRQRFNLYYVGIFLVDSSGDWAVLQAGTGEAGRQMLANKHRLRVGGDSMVGWCIANRQARIASDVGEDAVHFNNPLLPLTRSELALPLLTRGRVIGAATVQSIEANAFTPDDIVIQQNMADQLTVAVANARLFEQTQRSAREMSGLNEILRAVSQQVELTQVLEAAYHSIQALIPTDAFIVALYDAATDIITYPLVYDSGQRYEYTPRPMTPGNNLGRVIRSGEPILIHVTPEDLTNAPDAISAMGDANRPSASLLYVPLKSGANTIGVLSVQSYQLNAYTREHVALMNNVATQLAIGIENARLFEQTRRTAEELDEINRRLTGEAWQQYARSTTDTGVVWQANDQILSPVSAVEAPRLASGQIDVQRQGNDVQVAVPIILRGQLIGALRLRAPREKWTRDAETTARTIAGHIAQAAENTRLIDQTQQTAYRERTIAAVAERIRRANDLDTILNTAVSELNRVAQTDGVTLQLGFGDNGPAVPAREEDVRL